MRVASAVSSAARYSSTIRMSGQRNDGSPAPAGAAWVAAVTAWVRAWPPVDRRIRGDGGDTRPADRAVRVTVALACRAGAAAARCDSSSSRSPDPTGRRTPVPPGADRAARAARDGRTAATRQHRPEELKRAVPSAAGEPLEMFRVASALNADLDACGLDVREIVERSAQRAAAPMFSSRRSTASSCRGSGRSTALSEQPGQRDLRRRRAASAPRSRASKVDERHWLAFRAPA